MNLIFKISFENEFNVEHVLGELPANLLGWFSFERKMNMRYTLSQYFELSTSHMF